MLKMDIHAVFNTTKCTLLYSLNNDELKIGGVSLSFRFSSSLLSLLHQLNLCVGKTSKEATDSTSRLFVTPLHLK